MFNPGDCFAFYLINWQLIVADIANQIFFQILLAIPIMFTGNALYGHGIVLRIFGMINTVTYSSTLFFSALMTLNRATVFVAPKLNESLFNRKNILKPISAIWVYAIVIAITLDAGGCFKLYSEKDLLLGFICTEETVDPIIWAVRQYYRYSPNAMPVIMLFTYITIFVFLKITNPLKNMQNYLDAEQLRKRFRSERSFLIQGFLICGMLEIEDIAFNFLLAPPNNLAQLCLNIICNWIMIIQNLLNPIILFSFNNRIRKATKNVLLWRSSLVGISVVSGNFKTQQIGGKINIQQKRIVGNEHKLFKRINNINKI